MLVEFSRIGRPQVRALICAWRAALRGRGPGIRKPVLVICMLLATTAAGWVAAATLVSTSQQRSGGAAILGKWYCSQYLDLSALQFFEDGTLTIILPDQQLVGDYRMVDTSHIRLQFGFKQSVPEFLVSGDRLSMGNPLTPNQTDTCSRVAPKEKAPTRQQLITEFDSIAKELDALQTQGRVNYMEGLNFLAEYNFYAATFMPYIELLPFVQKMRIAYAELKRRAGVDVSQPRGAGSRPANVPAANPSSTGASTRPSTPPTNQPPASTSGQTSVGSSGSALTSFPVVHIHRLSTCSGNLLVSREGLKYQQVSGDGKDTFDVPISQVDSVGSWTRFGAPDPHLFEIKLKNGRNYRFAHGTPNKNPGGLGFGLEQTVDILPKETVIEAIQRARSAGRVP